MSRSACFEVRTSCPKCGQSVPVNGPFRFLFCSGCFETFSIPDDIIIGFLTDFEEESGGFSTGEGSGGTLMSGSGTFKYGYWKLDPRCSECKIPLVLPDDLRDTEVFCSCGRKYYVYPPPEWLAEPVPSAIRFVSSEREKDEGEPAGQALKTDSPKLIVMSCPQCAGTLSISAASERIMECTYCESEIYIPDAVWIRLHPARTTEEWFAVFDGKTAAQILNEQRYIDAKEQDRTEKNWRPRPLRKLDPKRRFKWLLLILGAAGIILLAECIMFIAGVSSDSIAEVTGIVLMVVVGIVFLVITLGGTFYMEIAYKWGYPGKCRKAMADIAAKQGWKHSGREHKHYMGSISAKYRGCAFEIHPDDDYAVEVSLNDSQFYLKTEPPGYPSDDLLRFTTANERFDSLFPVRYAGLSIIRRLETDLDDILEVFYWFIDRWEDRLARMKVDSSDLKVHLAPGHREKSGVAVRFIYPEEIEPLLEDMITLASAINRVTKGEKPYRVLTP